VPSFLIPFMIGLFLSNASETDWFENFHKEPVSFERTIDWLLLPNANATKVLSKLNRGVPEFPNKLRVNRTVELLRAFFVYSILLYTVINARITSESYIKTQATIIKVNL